MLRPDYLDGMPDRMVELYAQAEADILADMARRLQAYDYWVPSAEHQKKRLEQMGASAEYIYARLSALTGKREGELRQLFLEAATQALDSDRAYYLEAGLAPPTLDASAELQTVCNAGLRQTDGLFRNLTRTTAAAGAGQFGDALDRAWLQISTGAFDTDTAVRRAVKALAEHGLDAVRYESGATATVEAAVRRAVVTGVNQTCLKAQWTLAGWNCRHSFFPYFEGSPRAYTGKQLAEMDKKSIRYNGKRLTEYEASQQQRYIERQIRRWKREYTAMQAAGLDTYESSAKIAQWQARQLDFLMQTGLKRQSGREQIAGFGKKQAAAVRRDLAEHAKDRNEKR